MYSETSEKKVGKVIRKNLEKHNLRLGEMVDQNLISTRIWAEIRIYINMGN